jgi:hypothetical protein
VVLDPFHPPEAEHASATLITMATLAIVFGGPNILYYLLQAGTTLILVLAANTA